MYENTLLACIAIGREWTRYNKKIYRLRNKRRNILKDINEYTSREGTEEYNQLYEEEQIAKENIEPAKKVKQKEEIVNDE